MTFVGLKQCEKCYEWFNGEEGEKVCEECQEKEKRPAISPSLRSAQFVVELSYKGCSWPELRERIEEAIESLEEVTIVRVGEKI